MQSGNGHAGSRTVVHSLVMGLFLSRTVVYSLVMGMWVVGRWYTVWLMGLLAWLVAEQ